MAFALPTGLAGACFDRLGVGPPTDVTEAGHLLVRLARTMPAGTTAKLEAVARGRVPPGADPTPVAETWLARPGLAWSCWAVATLYVALVHAGGVMAADVLAVRRWGPGAPPVDFHSVVELRAGSRRYVVDPFFGVAPVAAPAGEALRPGLWGQAVADGPVWRTAVGGSAGRGILHYRSFSTALDRADVEALCHVSVTHTGVGQRPRVNLATADGSCAVTVDRDGAVRRRRWRCGPGQVWGGACETVVLDDWAGAERDVAARAVGG